MPDLRTEHAGAPAPRPRHLFWPALLAVALLINALLLLWWRPWQAPVPADAPMSATAPEGAATVAIMPVPGPTALVAEPPPVVAVTAANGSAVGGAPAPPAGAEPAGWSDLRRETQVQEPKRTAPRPASRSEALLASPPSAVLPHLRNLPDSFRRTLPDLTISMHYYDPDPAARLIRLNSRILREGSTVAEGLIVEEITAAGVILSWHGERFRAGDF